MSKTAAYIRVSTERQLDGSGPEQQRAGIMAYAAQHSIAIDEWATDDETGTTEDREQIQRLLAEARAGTLTTLLIDRMDRLGRKVAVCESLYEAFTQAGCQIRLVAMHFENNPAGVAMRQMLMVFAQYQKDEWLQRMAQCRRSKAARIGALANGQVPFGYRRSEVGALEVCPEEAPAVRRAFWLRKAGRSFRTIVAMLNAEGYRSRGGKPFTLDQVHCMIHRERQYAGLMGFTGGATAAQPALLDHPSFRTLG